MRIRTPLLSLILSMLVAGCHALDIRDAPPPGGTVPYFRGMGRHTRQVTTPSPQAQRYFDQGLVWAFAFNHDEAIRSFREAARLDPECGMAWWGIALCNGPHINNPIMDDEHSKAAWDALQTALAQKEKANPTERALIDALARRYAYPPPTDRKPLDEAYAAAMRDVWRAHPDDNDVGVLFAESMMDLRPWDLWTHAGQPQPGTEEILATLEAVLRRDSYHPGANHLYIHAVEASPQPERAMAAADRLRTLVPASGHLVHMPAHIDVRTGRWAQASEMNVRAIEADRKYRALSPRQGFYNVYMAHNRHFLSYSSMMEGRSENALRAAREMLAAIPPDFVRTQSAFADPFMPIALEVLMRFGRWDDLLREPAPPEFLPISAAFWHFSRGIALAAKGRVDDAQSEQARFRQAVERVPESAIMAINPARKVLRIADHVLAGEIAYRQGKIDDAVRELRAGVTIEDDLLYMEPPDWVQPVRHTLGAVLTDAGRHAEAEQVYRDDLKRWPENGWSLFGLQQCLKSRNAAQEAKEVERRFRKAWSRADIKLASTCLCVTKRSS